MSIMKIAVIGGTGKVGGYIAEKALNSGFSVRMLVRNPNELEDIDERVDIVKGDALDVESVRKLVEGCHGVINAYGQSIKETPLYSQVTINILNAMKRANVTRYIGVTGASLGIRGDNKNFITKSGEVAFEKLFPAIIVDKKRELNFLLNSGIDWTLVRIPFVIDSVRTKKVKVNLKDMPGLTITNGSIGNFLVHQMYEKKYILKAPFISN